MKEITVCFKAEVTKVVDTEDETTVVKAREILEHRLKDFIEADDLHVSHLKYFIREIEEDGND